MDKVKTVEDIKREYAPVQNTNEIHRNRLSKADKISLRITSLVGSMTFFYICLVLVTVPLIFSSTMTFIHYLSSGYLQLLLLPLILVSQNLQSKHSELRAQHDYETNVRSEKQIESILLHLEHQDKVVHEILKKIEAMKKRLDIYRI